VVHLHSKFRATTFESRVRYSVSVNCSVDTAVNVRQTESVSRAADEARSRRASEPINPPEGTAVNHVKVT
jgi:hypothetical protein